jgi:quercetin dioxygenase-like cupin family protein
MDNLLLINRGLNVVPLLLELKNNPQLWNEHKYRTSNPTSPHREVDDIWVRYNRMEVLENAPELFNAEHDSVWYPAIERLPSLRKMALDLMHYVGGERLGGILITRVKPGCRVYPHHDCGAWHSAYYDKYAIQLESAPGQSFDFDGESLSASPGDTYWFNNQKVHWVNNNSDVDRITVIVCIRTDKGA